MGDNTIKNGLQLSEKRKKAKKEGKDSIPEDDPAKYKHAVYVLTMKLFADMERKRRELADRDQEERKRKREAEIEDEENQKLQREWQKNFEVLKLWLVGIKNMTLGSFQESRQNRVNSWQHFQAGGSSKSKSSKKLKMFKPPKNKPESRQSHKSQQV